jgi:UDP-N-acetylmuramoyl-L-alanyl-D-glutamate--2,6-diaminopimelate ligase
MNPVQMHRTLGAFLDAPPACAAIAIGGLCSDSRSVQPGDAFIALRGARHDGLEHLAEVHARGAVAVLVETGRELPGNTPLPLVPVEGLAARAGTIAAAFYADPSAVVGVIGVTGTNGKTTTTQLIAQALAHTGTLCGVIGTLGSGFPGRLSETTHTTPDAVTLQRLLAELRGDGAQAVAMEVSSHALAQGRIDTLHVDTAVFTNLTHDHLDFHGSLEAYGAAKARLFAHPGLRHAVLNLDDPFGRRIHDMLPASVERVGFTLGSGAADIRATEVEFRSDGIRARILARGETGELRLPLIGRFNLENALAVIGALLVRGLSLELVLAALRDVLPVPGRMERVGDTPLVIVDYAHTPDALEQSLRAIRSHCRGRLWCVFGCGGDRDRSKRPLMGRLAREHADEVVVTSDNPRSEDPLAIIAGICAGIPDAGVIREADRRTAIFRAIREAGPVDCVLIAGKGHENYQEAGGVRAPFSDAAVAREALAARRRAP